MPPARGTSHSWRQSRHTSISCAIAFAPSHISVVSGNARRPFGDPFAPTDRGDLVGSAVTTTPMSHPCATLHLPFCEFCDMWLPTTQEGYSLSNAVSYT